MTIASNINIAMTQMSELFSMNGRLMRVDYYYSSLANQINNKKETKWEPKLDCNNNAITAYFIIKSERSNSKFK